MSAVGELGASGDRRPGLLFGRVRPLMRSAIFFPDGEETGGHRNRSIQR